MPKANKPAGTSGTMSPKALQLRDAHVAFLLQQCRGQALRRQIRLQVEGVLKDIAPIRFGDLISRETLRNAVVATVQKLDLGPELASLVGVIAREMYGHPAHEEITLAEVLPEVGLEVLFEQLMGLTELRKAVIHELVTNPVFSELISNLLLQGIGDFLRVGTGVDKVPGAASAMKLGQGLVKRATRGKVGDDTLKEFVNKHASASVRSSEDFLNRAFESDAVAKGASEIWNHMQGRPLADFRELVSAQQVEDMAMLATAFWREFRSSEFTATMLEAGADAYYARHEDNAVDTVLDELGVTPDLWKTVLSMVLPEVFQGLEASGALRRTLERLLDDFYASEELQTILDLD